ncbi:PTS transporter subunit EIIC [Spiroplasma endosymbiont of Aspidapion aeneum]|uniref:PTS transporter subunit EIIC n=1 Tax=Spiroplasma endosymbiont of Aspidapion aeneum TaxID=3066276 RepID=UPI00313EF073
MKNKDNQETGLRAKKPSFFIKFQDGLQKFGYKLGSNRILCSMRDGFAVGGVATMGAIFPAVLAVIFFNNATLMGKINGIHDSKFMLWLTDYIYPFMLSIQQVATAGVAIYSLVAIAYFMSKAFVKQGSVLTSTLLTIACWFALNPFGASWCGQIQLPWKEFSYPFSEIGIENIGANGLIMVMVVGISAPLFYSFLVRCEKLRIKLPDTIPSAIADVISSILIISIMLASYALFAWAYAVIAYLANIKEAVTAADGTVTYYYVDNIFTLINKKFGDGITSVATSPFFYGVLAFMATFLWLFGVHGTNIIIPLFTVVCTPLLITNIYFWSYYTSDAVQGFINGSPGTNPNDAYYDLVHHLNQKYWDTIGILNNDTVKYLMANKNFKNLLGTQTGTDEFAKAIAACLSDTDPRFHQSLIGFGNSVLGKKGTDQQAAAAAYSAISGVLKLKSMIDPVKGINLGQYGYHNGILLGPVIGLGFGGTGDTGALTIAILLFSKYKPYRKIAKIEVVPAIFNINEPLVFGLPIAFNFVWAIPYCLFTTIFAILITYLPKLHIVRPDVATSNAYLPLWLAGYFNTGMDWRVLPIGCILVSIQICYYSIFIFGAEKFSISMVAKNNEMTYEEYMEKNPNLYYKHSPLKALFSKEARLENKEEIKIEKD